MLVELSGSEEAGKEYPITSGFLTCKAVQMSTWPKSWPSSCLCSDIHFLISLSCLALKMIICLPPDTMDALYPPITLCLLTEHLKSSKLVLHSLFISYTLFLECKISRDGIYLVHWTVVVKIAWLTLIHFLRRLFHHDEDMSSWGGRGDS